MNIVTRKLGTAMAGFALMVGAVPATVGTAHAWETGQIRIKNPPGGRIKIALIVTLVAVTAAIFALSDGNDQPVSP